MDNFRRLKAACYTTNICMSVVTNFSPLLFMTFRNMYGISFSLLGLLVLVNYVTQLSVDLIFSFFSHKFNIEKTVKFTPVLTAIGLVFYAVYPFVFPNSVYVGLIIGTVIFAASGGLGEVLISPVIAAIPSDNPDREMSKLHSIYAWGVVILIAIATVFLQLFGFEKWQYLALVLAVVPLVACALFAGTKVPVAPSNEKGNGAFDLIKDKRLWLCVIAIFLGGAAECTMAQWSSGYLEKSLGISKVYGDIFGVAFFALALGLGRTLYAKFGKNLEKFLLFGAIGAFVCYLVAALSPLAIFGLIACGLTGFCVSMLWPGSLIVSGEYFPKGGVFIFAMMAAGGDLGASVGPQLVGSITDAVIANPSSVSLANQLQITIESLGLKVGMLVGALFPLIAIFIYAIILKLKKKQEKTESAK